MVFKLALMETPKTLRNWILSWKVKGDLLQRWIPLLSPSLACCCRVTWSLESFSGADFPASTAQSYRCLGRIRGQGLQRRPWVVNWPRSRNAIDPANPRGGKATNYQKVCEVLVLGIIWGLKATKSLCGRMPAGPQTGIQWCGELLGSIWQVSGHISRERLKTPLCQTRKTLQLLGSVNTILKVRPKEVLIANSKKKWDFIREQGGSQIPPDSEVNLGGGSDRWWKGYFWGTRLNTMVQRHLCGFRDWGDEVRLNLLRFWHLEWGPPEDCPHLLLTCPFPPCSALLPGLPPALWYASSFPPQGL